MDHRTVGEFWNRNAETWTRLVREGYDLYRDKLNTPAFFEMLPPIDGLKGIDIGCGEGHNTRELAKRGATMSAIDISEVFIRHARHTETERPLGIQYLQASAVELPFADQQFDFATAFMSLMDLREQDQALTEAFRVLKPGGFLQFSITHPCFDTPHRKNLRDADGKTYAIEVGEYFRPDDGTVEHWMFGAIPAETRNVVSDFQVPRFSRTLSQWLNQVLDSGFRIERCGEPSPSDEVVREFPYLQDAQVVAYFLHVLARKP